jgi:hypothetical protein
VKLFLFLLLAPLIAGATCGPYLAELRERPNSLAIQTRYDDMIDACGGGACATVTAVNLIQVLRQMKGLEPLDPDKRMLEVFETLPVLLKGRVTNRQMIDLLKHLDPDIEVGVATLGKRKHLKDRDLEILPGSLKLVVYKVFKPDGTLLGRHFVLLKERTAEGHVVVVDPKKPMKDFTYELKTVPAPETGGTTLQLVRPGPFDPAARRFTLDTVFTVTPS